MITRNLMTGINSIVKRNGSSIQLYQHLEALGEMYAKAPISGRINQHKIEFKNIHDSPYPSGVICMEAREELNHPGGTMHGSAYFKLLDDAAWFTAQGIEADYFIYTTSFTTYINRPVVAGTKLVASGKIVNATKSLIIAESKIVEETTGKLVASGSGTFMKSNVRLDTVSEYTSYFH